MSNIPEIDKAFDDFLKSEIKWRPVTIDEETKEKLKSLFEAGKDKEAQALIFELFKR